MVNRHKPPTLPLLFIVNEEEGVDRVPGTTVEDLKEAMQLKKMVGDADKVATLTTTEEIDAALAEEVPVVFKLFEQWCGHCKQLAPIYVKAATVIDNAKFVEIECSLNNDTQAFCEREVKGFPTVATQWDRQEHAHSPPRRTRQRCRRCSELSALTS